MSRAPAMMTPEPAQQEMRFLMPDDRSNNSEVEERIFALGEDIADMGRRIQNNGGELHYSAEKAYRAAKDAVRIMAAADAVHDVSADDWDLFGELRRAYVKEYREGAR